MSLWPRNKPLGQPPHFRTGQDTNPTPDPVIKAAVQALNHCRNERDAPKRVRNYAMYEAAKRAWVTANPGATPEQYDAAMRAIAERCGV